MDTKKQTVKILAGVMLINYEQLHAFDEENP